LDIKVNIERNDIFQNNKYAIKLSDVDFKYPDGTVVFENLSLSLSVGRSYAFVGPTGGGKSTFASLLSYLLRPKKGEISLYGIDINSYSPKQRAKLIGYVTQDPIVFNDSLIANILYGNDEMLLAKKEKVLSCINEFKLLPLLESFKSGLDTYIDPDCEEITLG